MRASAGKTIDSKDYTAAFSNKVSKNVGSYKVKVKVTAKGNSNYKAKTKKVTLKIKVK